MGSPRHNPVKRGREIDNMDASRIVGAMSQGNVEVMGLRVVVLTPMVIAGGTVEVTLKRVLSQGDLVAMDQTRNN